MTFTQCQQCFQCFGANNEAQYFFQITIEDFQPLKTLFLEKIGHGWKATSGGEVLIATHLFRLEKVFTVIDEFELIISLLKWINAKKPEKL